MPVGFLDSSYVQLSSATGRIALRVYCNVPTSSNRSLTWVPLDPSAPEPTFYSVLGESVLRSGGYLYGDFGMTGDYHAVMTAQEADAITRFDVAFFDHGPDGCTAVVTAFNGGAATVVPTVH